MSNTGNTKSFQKVPIQYTTDNDLLKQCEETLQDSIRDGSHRVDWITPRKGEEITPPKNTVAVLVTVPKNKGAIRIFEKPGSNQRIGAVGTEDDGHMVLIPWDSRWWFRASGSPKVGYLISITSDAIEE